MKKNIKSTDKISEGTLHEILLDIKYRLDHLEDIEADNRALIVKLIKQSNSIVKFLASIDIEPVDSLDDFEDLDLPKIGNSSRKNKITSVKELIDQYMEKRKDLEEFEKELEKHKDEITPGEVGES